MRRLAPLVLLLLLAGSGCSIKRFMIGKLGDALAGSGATYASDDDPELVRDALPFALKLIESLLEQTPDHRGLLLAAASGFTQYAYAFIQQDADQAADHDAAATADLRLRARGLYRRARGYGLRGLAAAHPDFEATLRRDPAAALEAVGPDEVPFLYWTAAAWGASISLAKEDPEQLADLPLVEALGRRAIALDEGYDRGALHEFLITLEASRPGGSLAAAREHFRRAVELSGGERAGPMVALAETVAVQSQDRAQFESLLRQALAVNPDARPEWRLANLVYQRRARWLLGRMDLLFAE